MKQILFYSSLVSIFVSFLLTGCASSSSDSETSSSEYDEPTSLETEEDGGYDDSDEEANFGLESMEQFESDEEVESKETEDTADSQVYLVRIVWGNLALNGRDDDDRTDRDRDWIDWTGSLSFDGSGDLILRRTILFDRHDSIEEEDDPLAIEWESYTGPHIDGLLTELVVATSGDPEGTLTFSTDEITQTIAVEELDHYNEIVTLDEEGHGAAFTALRIDDDSCSEGFLQGKFHDRPSGEGGVFRGRVLSHEGELNGHVRGHYGINDDEESVFFGKYINTSGRFRGHFRGEYDDSEFSGNWIAADDSLEGTLAGKYVTGTEVDSGFFQGFWEESCTE